MTKCSHCIDLQTTYEIRSPADLQKAIRVTQGNLADGTIVESAYWPEGAVKHSTLSFNDMAASTQWEDVIEYYFECSKCHSLFNLSAETYHGQGGRWSPFQKDGFISIQSIKADEK